MEYNQGELLLTDEDDCLKICRALSIDFFKIKFVIVYLANIALVTLGLILVQIYKFLETFDGFFFIKYAPAFIGALYVLTSILVLLDSIPCTTFLFENSKSWKINAAGREIEQQILKESKQANFFVLLNTLIAIIAGIFFTIPSRYDTEFFYGYFLLQEWFPDFSEYMSWFCRLNSIFLTFLLAASPGFQLMYVSSRLKFQIYMFLFYLKNINEDIKNLKDNYQEKVNERLIFCIRRYTEYYSPSNIALRILSKYVFFCNIVGVIFLSSIFVLSFTFQEDLLTEMRFRIISTSILALLTVICLVRSGQDLEDFTSNIFDTLFHLDWCNWNKNNKQIYLMFSLMVKQPFQLRFFESMSVNYKMGIEMIKTMFSMLSIIHTLRNKISQQQESTVV